ncbi:MAG TPA: UDP-3-O-(3-hydroxymyristoyl)glucosamine N-acyltransferase [Phycisphaerales bacterium]|nr:UDP-3-O-(3-hydroxymyristoyl)glucosamine N-acyltransferase [Phycisphaerales bacterium]HMP37317.1 UDP-3-O-(3-hydroxymyristoyl)glucosamine N-acyltransferase [Phycisphaerales bacterium]
MAEQQAAGRSVAELGALLGATVVGPAERTVHGVSGLAEAGPEHLSFVASARHARSWRSSKAGAILVTRGLLDERESTDGRTLLIVEDAEDAMTAMLEVFAPPPPLPEVGVHPTAWVDRSAALGDGVRIGPHVSVDAGTTLGEGVVLHAGVRLYREVSVGPGSTLHANVVVRERCRLGARVIVHAGAVIGADGFGYRADRRSGGLRKVPQIGVVVVEDDVEIGAATCIDRAKFGATTIGRGTKLDNLIQVAHNCRIGRSCVIAANVGLAGSVVLGDGVQVGGAASFAPHVVVGDGARIGATSGVLDDVPAGAAVIGTPAAPAVDALRQVAAVRRLPELLRAAMRAGIVARDRGGGAPKGGA